MADQPGFGALFGSQGVGTGTGTVKTSVNAVHQRQPKIGVAKALVPGQVKRGRKRRRK